MAALCADMTRKVAFAKENVVALARVGITDDLLTQIQTSVAQLERNAGEQEKTVHTLPDATRAFSEAKGRLYDLIRDMNNAGRAFYCADQEKASRFNLKLLYRRGKPAEAPVPSPVPPAKEIAIAK